ncbi:helix-turn-helix domain-containing protein [Streptomyces sp. NPDC046931]|uniref:helix-turn-helix domain-containing protein n=1 Tax=Streptomyces sp. NPDC046931 TaxID=3154806 RepID=UPI003401867F
MSDSTRRPLPPSLDPQTAYLVGVLRELKDRSGLSLTALAARTPYSRSSWDRYLRGLKLPPRQAVEMLARLAGEPSERLVALWELAEAQSSGRDAEPVPCMVAAENTTRQAPAEFAPDSDPSRRYVATDWIRLAVIVVAAVAAVAWALAEIVGPLPSTAPSAGPGPFKPVPLTVGCRGDQCLGREAGAMACDIDSSSYADLRIGLSHVELRVSRNCDAAWARLSYSSVGDRVRVEDRAGSAETATVINRGATDQYVVTRMLPAGSPVQLRACWEPRTGGRRCTAWGRATPIAGKFRPGGARSRAAGRSAPR